MDRRKVINIVAKFLVFFLALSSAVSVWAIISYANYTLFTDWLPTKVFTYVGAIGIGMVTYYLVSTYLGKLVNSFRQQPQAQFIKFYKYQDPFTVDSYYREEQKPSFLVPFKRK